MSDFLGDDSDVLSNILRRLPAKSFAAASCVNRSWSKACGHILSRPCLVSALSLNPNPNIGVEEVIQKVLCKPIRPHFAIAFVGSETCLDTVHSLIARNLGSNTPLITNATTGLIGRDAITNRFKEVQWDLVNSDVESTVDDFHRGIGLMVGFVPGLKTSIFPLLHTKSKPSMAMVDKFVSDIQSSTALVSAGDANPVGVILFGAQHTDLRPIIAYLDEKIPRETVVMGDASNCFIYTDETTQGFDTDLYSLDAIGLVFAKHNPNNSKGEIKFHVGISSGIMPCGPRLEVVEVVENKKGFSWLTAKSQDQTDILDASGIVDTLGDTIEDECYTLYIGVMQECSSNGSQCPTKYLAFHELLGTDHEVFIVSGTGIKPGDSFLIHHSDSDTAKSSCINVYNDFNSIANPTSANHIHRRRRRSNTGHSVSVDPISPREEEVFGGIIFASSTRGESFFGEPRVDSMPFCENFPRVPLCGTFCSAPFGRRAVFGEENDEERCSVQVFSTVYLAMTYVPPTLQL